MVELPELVEPLALGVELLGGVVVATDLVGEVTGIGANILVGC